MYTLRLWDTAGPADSEIPDGNADNDFYDDVKTAGI